MTSPRNIVLLTATVTPRAAQTQLAIQDPGERLNDYRKALFFYNDLLANGTIDGLVFVENSDFDLGRLRAEFPSSLIEWIGFYDLDYPSSYHRGYGEFRLIDRAMHESTLIRSLAAADVIWKVTGRYIVENLSQVLRSAPTFDLYCHSTPVWTEMSLMAWTLRGFRTHIEHLWKVLATDKAPELILAERISSREADTLVVVTEFAWPPLIVGRRGTDGSNFTGRLTRLKFNLKLTPFVLRQILRRLKPSHAQAFNASKR